MDQNLKIILDAFPKELEEDIRSIFKVIMFKFETHTGRAFEVSVNNEMILIPERIYFEDFEEDLIEDLTELQKQILYCLFTRHHNGYIRQKRLNKIFNSNIIYYWSIPYIIRLLGEYVVEIIDDIYKHIEQINKIELMEFIKNNERFILTTEGRIASYWGEYYRSDYKKDNYVGFKVKKYIQAIRKNMKRGNVI